MSEADTLIDKSATTIAQSIADGADEVFVRWQIASLVQESSVPHRVAHRDARFYGPQGVADYVEYLCDKLVTVIVKRKTCDLSELAKGESFSAWMYGICSSHISRAEVREAVQPHNKRIHGRDQRAPIEMVDLDVEISDDVHGDLWIDTWRDAHASMLPTAKLHNEQIHLKAKVLIGAYHLREIKRGIYLPNRQELLDSLSDPKAATRDTLASIRWKKIIGLAVLWNDQLDEMAELPTIVTNAIALSALTPFAPPTANTLKMLVNSLDIPKHQAGRLVRAFANCYSETYTSEYTHGEVEPKSREEHLANVDVFYAEAVLIGDPDEVYEMLRNSLIKIERERIIA